MKKFIIIPLLAFSSIMIGQIDTVHQTKTELNFRVSNELMRIKINTDTVVSAKLYVKITQLAWGNSKNVVLSNSKDVRDSLVNLFSGVFEGIMDQSGVRSIDNSEEKIDITYILINFNDTIESMEVLFDVRRKSPNGSLLSRIVKDREFLSEEQIGKFELLLNGKDIYQLYLDHYNTIINEE